MHAPQEITSTPDASLTPPTSGSSPAASSTSQESSGSEHKVEVVFTPVLVAPRPVRLQLCFFGLDSIASEASDDLFLLARPSAPKPHFTP